MRGEALLFSSSPSSFFHLLHLGGYCESAWVLPPPWHLNLSDPLAISSSTPAANFPIRVLAPKNIAVNTTSITMAAQASLPKIAMIAAPSITPVMMGNPSRCTNTITLQITFVGASAVVAAAALGISGTTLNSRVRTRQG